MSAKDSINVKQLFEHCVKIFYPEEQKVEQKLRVFHEATSNGNQQDADEMINQKNSSCCCC